MAGWLVCLVSGFVVGWLARCLVDCGWLAVWFVDSWFRDFLLCVELFVCSVNLFLLSPPDVCTVDDVEEAWTRQDNTTSAWCESRIMFFCRFQRLKRGKFAPSLSSSEPLRPSSSSSSSTSKRPAPPRPPASTFRTKEARASSSSSTTEFRGPPCDRVTKGIPHTVKRRVDCSLCGAYHTHCPKSHEMETMKIRSTCNCGLEGCGYALCRDCGKRKGRCNCKKSSPKKRKVRQ